MKKDIENKKVDRREFLVRLGLGGIVAGTALAGCSRAAKKAGVGASNEAVDPVTKTGEMTYRVNHNTGDRVSLLGYGMMRLPMKGHGPDAEIDQEAVNDLVDYAMAHGVNYYDTSPVYCKGKSEESTGIALSRHPRDSYFIATKLSNFSEAAWPLKESIKMFENSLKELRTDYVDYLLLHAVGGGGLPNLHSRFLDNGLLDYLKEQKEKGRIRNLGFSFHGDVEVYDYLLAMHDAGEAHWDFVQIQHNYVDWHNKEGNAKRSEYLYNELAKRDIPAVVMEPLLGGRLALLPDHLTETLKTARPQDSLASWAFRFAGSQPGILTVLSGMTYLEHLQDNLHTYSPLEVCSEEECEMLERTAQLLDKYPLVPCTKCQYCMPCPYGLNIPGIFEHYNKCVNEGNVSTSRQDPDYERARKAFLVGYDRAIPKLRQASQCTGCGVCLSHCPQSIKIPNKLQEIDRYVEELKLNGCDIKKARDARLVAARERLDKGGCLGVLKTVDGAEYTFNRQGIIDVFEILRDNPALLDKAAIADKIIGKGVAAMMVLGKVSAVYGKVMSKAGKEMLEDNGIVVQYDELVDKIINRAGTDECPVEKLTASARTAQECLPLLTDFVAKNF